MKDCERMDGGADEEVYGPVHGLGGRLREGDEGFHARAAEKGHGRLDEVDGEEQEGNRRWWSPPRARRSASMARERQTLRTVSVATRSCTRNLTMRRPSSLA